MERYFEAKPDSAIYRMFLAEMDEEKGNAPPVFIRGGLYGGCPLTLWADGWRLFGCVALKDGRPMPAGVTEVEKEAAENARMRAEKRGGKRKEGCAWA